VYDMAARVFNAANNQPLPGASVKIISFIEPDVELVANSDGIVDFSLHDGTAFMVVGTKDGFVGMFSGTAEKGMDKASVIHPVPANDEPKTELPVVGRIVDEHGKVIENAEVTVTEKSSGKKVDHSFKDGLLSFAGELGKDYHVTAIHE